MARWPCSILVLSTSTLLTQHTWLAHGPPGRTTLAAADTTPIAGTTLHTQTSLVIDTLPTAPSSIGRSRVPVASSTPRVAAVPL